MVTGDIQNSQEVDEDTEGGHRRRKDILLSNLSKYGVSTFSKYDQPAGNEGSLAGLNKELKSRVYYFKPQCLCTCQSGHQGICFPPVLSEIFQVLCSPLRNPHLKPSYELI